MTNLEKHLGSSHFSTTGVVLTKCSSTLQLASLPWWCIAFIVGNDLGLLPVVNSSRNCFKRMRLVIELLQYFWSAISSWEDTVFSYMFSIEPLEFFAHLCAGFLAYFYSFNAISASSSPCDGLVRSKRPWSWTSDMKQVCFDTLSLLLSFLGLSLPLRDLRDRLPVILRNSISLNSSAMRGYSRIDTYAVSWQSMPHYPFLQRSTLSCRYSWQKNCFVH